MAAPSLSRQFQGVGSVSADQLNTDVQWTNVASDLRAFTGLSTMQVMVAGNAAINDGGQGVFYWNGSSTAADNGSTVIAPTGTATGRWLRLGYVGAAPLATVVLISQVRQELAIVDLANPPAVAGHIPASPYNPVNIDWNGQYMRPNDSLYNFIAAQLGYTTVQMATFFANCAALPVSA